MYREFLNTFQLGEKDDVVSDAFITNLEPCDAREILFDNSTLCQCSRFPPYFCHPCVKARAPTPMSLFSSVWSLRVHTVICYVCVIGDKGRVRKLLRRRERVHRQRRLLWLHDAPSVEYLTSPSTVTVSTHVSYPSSQRSNAFVRSVLSAPVATPSELHDVYMYLTRLAMIYNYVE